MTESDAPLQGLRVLEVAQNLAGPYCGQILADLGADVIKVERPGGDAAREWGPPFVGGTGSIFAATNRGKRSIVLDLNDEHDGTALRRLIEHSDVLIEAFRPGAFARLGYDSGTVSSWNPRLIQCSVLAYGETGPLRELPGYDPLMQAHGGLMSVTGTGPGAEARVGTSIIDMGTGMWLGIAVLAALRDRDRTGHGRRITVSLYDTALAWNAYHLTGHAATGVVPRPMGTELPMIVPYGAFRTTDGSLMIAAGNDRIFASLCTALGLTGAAGDPRFSTNPLRVAERAEVNRIVTEATSQFSTQALLELLRAAGVPCAPILDIGAVAADEQTAASGMIAGEGDDSSVALPIRWSGVRPMARRPVPGVGEHTAEVLAELARTTE